MFDMAPWSSSSESAKNDCSTAGICDSQTASPRAKTMAPRNRAAKADGWALSSPTRCQAVPVWAKTAGTRQKTKKPKNSTWKRVATMTRPRRPKVVPATMP
eukprot:Amastigsp_a341009_23.p7 type:complete len:101 gc:universal Amastigsp_a341009_23:1158-856(-)